MDLFIKDFVYFSFIEALLYCLYYGKICKLGKFKWYDVLAIALGNCVISNTFPPIMYQLIMVIYMGGYLRYTEKSMNIFKCVKNVFIALFVYRLIIETIFIFLYENIFKINWMNLNKEQLFLYMIPSNFILFILFMRGRVELKSWWGSGVERK